MQTYQNWELLIVDDCSTDDTKDIVSSFKDSRIKYKCLEKNSGAAVARNTALKLAEGRWVAFLDSDDIWDKKKLEKQLHFMLSHDYKFSYTDYEEISEESSNLGIVVSGPKRITKFGMFAFCWPGCLTVMYDRSAIGLIQIPDIRKNNDYAMWLQIIQKADCYRLSENLAFYRKRIGSISNHSKFNLIKWHYRLFRIVGNNNPFLASLLTINNLFWGLLKKIFYVRKRD